MENILSLITQLDLGGTEANDSNSVPSASSNEAPNQDLEDSKTTDSTHTGDTQLGTGATEANDSNSVPSASSNEAPNQDLEDSETTDRTHTGDTQLGTGATEANDSNSVPSASSNEAPNQDLEVLLMKHLYETKEKFNLCFRASWDNYWDKVLRLILSGKKPTFQFHNMYQKLHRSLSEIMKQENIARSYNMRQGVAEDGPTPSTSSRVDLENIEKIGLCEIKENFRKQSISICKYYWEQLSHLLKNNESLKSYLFPAEKLLSMRPPQISYKQNPASLLSIRSWLLLNPTRTEQREEELILVFYQSKFQAGNRIHIMEQKTDVGVNAECILLKRLQILKKEKNIQFEGKIELVCSWSSRTRSIKLANDIKEINTRIKKISIKTRRKPSTATSLTPDIEVHHFGDADWKELCKYLTNEGKSYIGVGGPSESQISEVLNSSVVHRRVLPLSMWFLFNEQLRIWHVEHLACILCCVEFQTATSFCLFETNESGVHAEPFILMRLEEMQAKAKKRNDSIRCIRIYSTYSPCVDCSSRYSTFLQEMPELEELHLIVSCVYNARFDGVNSALKHFWEEWKHKVKLEAFNDDYWNDLKEHLMAVKYSAPFQGFYNPEGRVILKEMAVAEV